MGIEVQRESYSFILYPGGNEKLLMSFKQGYDMFAFEKDHYAYEK